MIATGSPATPVAEGTVRRLAKPQPAVTAVSWDAYRGMSLAEWVGHGRRLGVMGRGVGWWLGDWLRFGNAAYGERYGPAARVTGYDRQSLMNMAYVASRVEPSRRREKLSWTHHAEVAALAPAEQDEWLDRAQREQMSARCLREALRTHRRAASAAPAERGGEQPAPHEHDDRCPSCGRPLASSDAVPAQ